MSSMSNSVISNILASCSIISSIIAISICSMLSIFSIISISIISCSIIICKSSSDINIVSGYISSICSFSSSIKSSAPVESCSAIPIISIPISPDLLPSSIILPSAIMFPSFIISSSWLSIIMPAICVISEIVPSAFIPSVLAVVVPSFIFSFVSVPSCTSVSVST